MTDKDSIVSHVKKLMDTANELPDIGTKTAIQNEIEKFAKLVEIFFLDICKDEEDTNFP